MFVKNPEYFLTIVKERSISRAADRLYLSQPYLSQYLAKLEANLGVTLLDRSHTPLQLTAAGELFHAYLERPGLSGPAAGERPAGPPDPEAAAAAHRGIHLAGLHPSAGHPPHLRAPGSGRPGGPP